MPKIGEIYQSRFITSDDFQNPVQLTILRTYIDSPPTRPGETPRQQVVLQFHETQKELGLNRSNATVLASMYGDDTDYWQNKKVVIFKEIGMSFGQQKWLVKIRDERAYAAPQAGLGAAPAAAVNPAPVQSAAVGTAAAQGLQNGLNNPAPQSAQGLQNGLNNPAPQIGRPTLGGGSPPMPEDDDDIPF